MSFNSPFDYVKAINDNFHDVDNFDKYVPYIVNKALSMHADCIMPVNYLNLNSHIDKELQYRYLANSVRRKKRYSKWIKNVIDEDIKLLAEAYNVNYEVAKEYKKLLSDDDIETIRKRLEKGGKE